MKTEQGWFAQKKKNKKKKKKKKKMNPPTTAHPTSSPVAIRRIMNEIAYYYTPAPPANATLSNGWMHHKKTKFGSSTSNIQFVVVFGKSSPPAAAATTTTTTTSIEVTVKKLDGSKPALVFHIPNTYPYIPPRMYINGSHEYVAYLARSMAWFHTIQSQLPIYDHIIAPKWCCPCCRTKMVKCNWNPGTHLVDIADEVYYAMDLKRDILHSRYLRNICAAKTNNIDGFIESYIFSFLSNFSEMYQYP